MILGTDGKAAARYALSGAAVLLLTGLTWLVRRDTVEAVIALRRSLGAASYVSLCLALALGPLAVLWAPARKWLPWRREIGVWFAVLALAHGLLIAGVSFQWRVWTTFSSPVGLPNLMGLAALAMGLLLAATSSDRAVAFLGIGSWKWLHYLAYAIFYLVAGHLVYFVFISSRSAVNRLGAPYLLMSALVIGLQAAAFTRIVARQRARLRPPASRSAGRKKRRFSLAVTGRKQVAENTWEVSFDTGGSGYRYQAGQYAGFRLAQLEHPDPKGPFRVFSFASSPADRRQLSIAFRDTGSGFKKTLLALPPGTRVEVGPPAGFLLLPPSPGREKLVFVAGGIGITPFLSLMRFATERKTPHRIHLIYANRSDDSSAYLEEIRRLAAQNRRLRWQNLVGETALPAALRDIEKPADRLWYTAGPGFMVAEVKNLLQELGVPADRIISEDFAGY